MADRICPECGDVVGGNYCPRCEAYYCSQHTCLHTILGSENRDVQNWIEDNKKRHLAAARHISKLMNDLDDARVRIDELEKMERP